MKVHTMKLQNFRCFKDLEMTFDPRMTVIVGDNAAGKTAILKGLTSGLGAYLSGIDSDAVKAPGIDIPDVRYETVSAGQSLERQPQFPASIQIQAEFEPGKSVCWTRLRKAEKGRTTRSDSKPAADIAHAYHQRIRKGDETLTLPMIGFYGTERLWLQKKDGRKNQAYTRISGYIDCLDGKSNEKLMLKWFEQKSWKEFNTRQSNRQLDSVKQAVTEIFIQLTGADEADLSYDPELAELVLIYRNQTEGQISRNFSSLSDGYRELLSLAADITWRMAVLNPQLESPYKETPGIIMIDEIELHLHPKWQSIILNCLQAVFPKVQFVVTTHSPLVIQSIEESRLRILREQDQIGLGESDNRGASLSSILNGIMGASDRPRDVEEMFRHLDNCIDQQDWSGAEECLHQLRRIVGDSDEEVLKQQTIVNFEKDQE